MRVYLSVPVRISQTVFATFPASIFASPAIHRQRCRQKILETIVLHAILARTAMHLPCWIQYWTVGVWSHLQQFLENQIRSLHQLHSLQWGGFEGLKEVMNDELDENDSNISVAVQNRSYLRADSTTTNIRNSTQSYLCKPAKQPLPSSQR